MRKILFKGFAPNNDGKQIITLNGKDYRGDWVEGFVLKLTETRWAITDYYPVNPHSGAFANKRFNTGDMIIKLYEIIPQTLCQFTGLKDINGKKIFEGDILKGFQYPYLSDGEYNYYAEVCWFDNCPAFGLYTFKVPDAKVRGISEGNTNIIEDFASEDWEVIGNIHDKEEE